MRRRGTHGDAINHEGHVTSDYKKPLRSRASLGMRVVLILLTACLLVALVQWNPSLLRLQGGGGTSSFAQDPILLSRDISVNVSSDVKGNLGPASVLNQRVPGTDWIKDRWQAAADMHGTAIRGLHWVKLDFPITIIPSTIVLDWETALSTDYEIQGRHQEEWISLFDSKKENFTSSHFGQSPGVKKKLPLHIVHNISLIPRELGVVAVRVLIRSSDMGWGVSLWQVDVYGWRT